MPQKYTKFDFFSIFCDFHTKYLSWVIEFQKKIISLGKIFDIQGTFGRGGWNSMGNLATQTIVQNIQEIPITQTVQSVL